MPIGGAHLPYRYCPLCGEDRALAQCDPEEDWWQAMCDTYGLPKFILEGIYDLWKSDPDSVSKFSDYVTKFREEANTLYEEVTK